MQAVTAPAAFWVVLGELNHTQKWHRVSHHPPECHMPRGKFFSALSFAQSGKKGRERYGKHQQQEEETSCTGGYKYITVILL